MNRDEPGSMPESERILLALAETGFDLEWKTGQALTNAGYKVRINQRGEARDSIMSNLVTAPETDVIGERFDINRSTGQLLFVECKGAQPGSHLVLIECLSDKYLSIPRLFLDGDKTILLDYKQNICPHPTTGPFVSENGDIFSPSQKNIRSGLQLASKDSNLFKGTTQICDGIDANAASYRDPKLTIEIVPILVTNAEVKLVRMNEGSVRSVPWAFFLNPNVFTSTHSRLGSSKWINRYPDRDTPAQRQIPGVWIVQAQRIEQFLTSYPRAQYENKNPSH